MKKIKGIYNGYELDDGKGAYALGGTRFYRVKDYIEYLKSLENAFKRN